MPKDRSKFAMIFLVIAGLGCLVTGFFMFKSSEAESSVAATWPSTVAHIDESRIERSYNNTTTTTSYDLVISYSYQVGGRRYTSNRYSLSGWRGSADSDEMQQLQSRLPEGSTQTAYYNPENPSEAVLDRSSPGGAVGITIGILGIVLWLVTGIIWFLMRRATS